ncbi:uracil phosphoribosyltransferase [Schlesneria paludicola]|uniref:uracil phosphoribosyltransferase n=1 Tax=Schlesneria paludicola TaxID=360056 RepID=UPI00029A98C6|nr:uracil phosphoribosyltransferase [Schlesneria paludicola]
MAHVVEIGHPLVQHHLSRLRDRDSSPEEFRASMRRLASLLAYEATSDLVLMDSVVQTPLVSMTGQVLRHRVGLVPILRAGLGMVDPILDLIPTAEVWHVGMYRDERTAEPVEYYCKIPKSQPVDVGIVLDPMLATGGSAILALEALQKWGLPTTKLLCVIASREGIDVVLSHFPDVQIFVCAIDPELNAQKFIVPGLGDAGDRTFNTLRSQD